MFADDHRGHLPASRFNPDAPDEQPALHKMTIVRVSDFQDGGWDGLGILFAHDYLPAAGVFYCPSHFGEHPYSRYADLWNADSGDIVSNYHFRGLTRFGLGRDSERTALSTDGLSTRDDYSHRVGSNILRADLSVVWFDDPRGSLVELLPENSLDDAAPDKVADAWVQLDTLLPDFSATTGPAEASRAR
jgi:hypothetical protein